MNEDSFDELLELVQPHVRKQDTVMGKAIPPADRLSLILRFWATGNAFQDLKFMTAISPPAIGEIVMETCNALIDCLQSYVKLPKIPEEWKLGSDDFSNLWNFPRCLGLLDGKHVAIRKPPNAGSFYFNYKNHFSIVLLAVVNARYEFIMLDAGMNGRVFDGGVMNHSTFGIMFQDNKLNLPVPEPLHDGDTINVPYYFVVDDAFAMTENLLKPHMVLDPKHLIKKNGFSTTA